MLSMGYLGEFLVNAAGARRVRKFRARFAKLTWPGDVITCRGTVTARARRGRRARRRLRHLDGDADRRAEGRRQRRARASRGPDRWREPARLRDRYAIAGIGLSRFGKVPGTSAMGFCLEAAKRAIDDCGVERDAIDGVLALMPASMGEQHGWASRVAAFLGITPTYCSTMDMGGATAIGMMQTAVMAIEAGFCSTRALRLRHARPTRRASFRTLFGSPVGHPVRRHRCDHLHGAPGAPADARARHHEPALRPHRRDLARARRDEPATPRCASR